MLVAHSLNGRPVEVADDYGRILIANGLYVAVDETPNPSPRKPRKTAQKPAQPEK